MKHFLFIPLLIIFSCTKENIQMPKVTSNAIIGTGTATVTVPAYPTATYLKSYPNAPVKYTLDITGYLIPTSVAGIEVYVLYNRLNGRTAKLWYKSFKRTDGSWRNQLYSLSGVLVFSMDVLKREAKPDTVYNVKIGTLPYINLGYYTVNPPKEIQCSRTSGFNACYICARDDCHSKWYCDLTCKLAHGACELGYIASCAILNIPHSAGGKIAQDTLLKYIYKIPIPVQYNFNEPIDLPIKPLPL